MIVFFFALVFLVFLLIFSFDVLGAFRLNRFSNGIVSFFKVLRFISFMLYLIGLGSDYKDLSVKALDAIKRCKEVYIEGYTSVLTYSLAKLEKLVGKKIKVLDRAEVEEQKEFFKNAKKFNIALLIIGDPLSATTHFDIISDAKNLEIKTKVIHSISIFTLAARTGLFLYKFGKTASVPFPQENFRVESFYDVILDNQKIKAHSLLLLDLNPREKKFLSIREAIDLLLDIAKKRKDTKISRSTGMIGCARLGTDNEKIVFGKASKLQEKNFGKPPYCLIIPSELNFMEEEFLKRFV